MSDKFSKTKKHSISRLGFTLIELMIVLAIFAVMTGVLFATKSSKKAAVDVESAARQVAAQLRSLQNDALNGKKIDINGDGVDDVNACEMRFNTKPVSATKSYRIGYYCSNTLITGSGKDLLIGKSANNVSLSGGTDYYVKFTPPQATVDTNLPVIGAARAIAIKSEDNTVTNLVCIYGNSNIIETKEDNCPTL